MEPPRQVQYLTAATEDEKELIERVLAAKDRILKLTPGFLEDAEEFQSRLRPHNADIYLRPDDFSAKECQQAEMDNIHNVQVANEFATKWLLPWIPSPNHAPHYLAERPFSGAPLVGGTLFAVTEWGPEDPPLLSLNIDIRFPKRLLLERIDDRIDQARRRWMQDGKPVYSATKAEAKKLEDMLRVHELRGRGTTVEEVAQQMGVEPRHVHRLSADLDAILKDKQYWTIAPYTDLAWGQERGAALARHHVLLCKKGGPFQIRPIS